MVDGHGRCVRARGEAPSESPCGSDSPSARPCGRRRATRQAHPRRRCRAMRGPRSVRRSTASATDSGAAVASSTRCRERRLGRRAAGWAPAANLTGAPAAVSPRLRSCAGSIGSAAARPVASRRPTNPRPPDGCVIDKRAFSSATPTVWTVRTKRWCGSQTATSAVCACAREARSRAINPSSPSAIGSALRVLGGCAELKGVSAGTDPCTDSSWGMHPVHGPDSCGHVDDRPGSFRLTAQPIAAVDDRARRLVTKDPTTGGKPPGDKMAAYSISPACAPPHGSGLVDR